MITQKKMGHYICAVTGENTCFGHVLNSPEKPDYWRFLQYKLCVWPRTSEVLVCCAELTKPARRPLGISAAVAPGVALGGTLSTAAVLYLFGEGLSTKFSPNMSALEGRKPVFRNAYVSLWKAWALSVSYRYGVVRLLVLIITVIAISVISLLLPLS